MSEEIKQSDPDQSPSDPPPELPKPIRVVRRQIECPDGGIVEVDVPVYPPFRFELKAPDSGDGETSASAPAKPPIVAKAPGKKTPKKKAIKLSKPGGGSKKARG
ncbi:MAG: hypothetical protein VCB99_04180 [Myxococcota bacterium]